MLVDADANAALSCLGDQEWHDLGMDDLFAEIDRTSGAAGQQLLYHRLRNPARTSAEFAALGEFEASAHRFSDDVGARERSQATLARLDDSAVYALPRLFLAQLPPRPRLAWLFPALALAPIVMLLAALAGAPYGWQILLALLCLNFVVRHIVAAEVAWIAQPFRALHVLLDVADRLVKQQLLSQRIVGQSRARLVRLKRITSFIGVVDGAGDDVLRAFVDYFNMLFLVDLNVFTIALGECERRRHDVRVVFDAVGGLDAALAVASFRAGRPAWCRPVILPLGSGLDISGLAHPLLPDARPNDLSIERGRGIVITGSNMSGKTTLLRALGVNAILAQTVNTCIATRFACPPFAVRTAISLADNMMGGKSYYLTEATTVLSMLRVDHAVQHLFLLDELFRGTNTVERIAAGVAVMESLVSQHDMAVVATHDVEIVRLVGGTYEARHFGESITPTGFTFDFVLRAGPATERNAISLLGVLGAPASLLDRAARICAQLESDALPGPASRRLS